VREAQYLGGHGVDEGHSRLHARAQSLPEVLVVEEVLHELGEEEEEGEAHPARPAEAVPALCSDDEGLGEVLLLALDVDKDVARDRRRQRLLALQHGGRAELESVLHQRAQSLTESTSGQLDLQQALLSKAHAIMGVPLPAETHYSVERAKIEAFKARLQAAGSDDVGLPPDAQRRLIDAILLRFKEIPPTIIHCERQTRSSGPVRGTAGLELVEAKLALQLAQDRVSELSADDRRRALEAFRPGLGAAFAQGGTCPDTQGPQPDESEAPREMTPPTCPLNTAPLLADGQPLSATALDGFLSNHKTKENLIILFQYALDAMR